VRVPRSPIALLAVALLAAAVAGCGSGSGAPDPTASAVSPSVSPSPTGPTPTPRAAAALAVLDGLRAFAADEEQSFRVKFEGDSRHTTDILAVKGTLDVSGDDAAIEATFRFPGQGKAGTEYRRIGEKDWLRIEGDRWRLLEGVEAADVVDPFAGTHDGTGLQYLGPVDGNPERHRVELDAVYLHPSLIPAGNLTAEKVTRTKLLLVTDAAGVPVSGTWSLHGQGRVSGQLQAIAIDLELTFSAIGKPVSIEKP
jgi:hypothetical protein